MQDKTDSKKAAFWTSGYSPIKVSSNAPDEYVILDKISRFRQDYQMSAITKIGPTFGKIL